PTTPRSPLPTHLPYTPLFRSDATVIPVVETSTLTAKETTSNRRKVASAADDEAMMVALSTAVAVALSAAVSDANGAEISSLTTRDRKSTRLNSSHEWISYAVF